MKFFGKGYQENLVDGSNDVFANSSDKYHSVLYLRHVRSDTLLVHEEVPEFTVESLISDIGGLTGIFLGLSFWSLFEAFYNFIFARLFSS